jgi:hypothetical protein
LYRSCRREGGRGGLEGGFDVGGPFQLVFGDSICVPFPVMFVKVKDTREVVSRVIVVTVAAFRSVGTVRNIIVLLTLVTAAFSEHVMIFFAVTTVAFRAPVVVKATSFSTMGPSPAFLTLGNEFPGSSVLDSDELTTYMIHFVDDILCVNTVLGVPDV